MGFERCSINCRLPWSGNIGFFNLRGKNLKEIFVCRNVNVCELKLWLRLWMRMCLERVRDGTKLIRFIFPFICNAHICGLNKSQVNAIHLQNSSYEWIFILNTKHNIANENGTIIKDNKQDIILKMKIVKCNNFLIKINSLIFMRDNILIGLN